MNVTVECNLLRKMLTFVGCNICHLARPGVRYREMGDIIQKHAQSHGFSVVRSYCGHGIHRRVVSFGLKRMITIYKLLDLAVVI